MIRKARDETENMNDPRTTEEKIASLKQEIAAVEATFPYFQKFIDEINAIETRDAYLATTETALDMEDEIYAHETRIETYIYENFDRHEIRDHQLKKLRNSIADMRCALTKASHEAQIRTRPQN